ncbi:alpha/beta fold hydrolase [Bacillus sp. V3-13]|uniref:alpha/beta fold hydrolase n=1 Tax=Bacillus sp. V3-13 TaxID=2053728 RepID=UPI0021522372|nr:alpha/beta fold hydrolase [Bacillus sp. V3-13]
MLFIHCAGPQGPQQGSQPLLAYLQAKLGEEYVFYKPKLSDPESPAYRDWKRLLDEQFKVLSGQQVIVVGHSLGASVLLKYLSENDPNIVIEGLFLLATPYWGTDEDWQNVSYQLQANYSEHLPPIPNIYFYHSRIDPVVPYVHFEKYLQDLSGVNGRVLDGEEHYFEEGLPMLVEDLRKK